MTGPGAASRRLRVVVVGAGIAGLTAAYALRTAVPGIQVIVLEAAERIGGKLATATVAGCAVDVGAEAMLARAPEGTALATAVGLGAQIRYPGTGSASLLVDGGLRPVPAGTLMGVPADPDAVARAGVLSDEALAAVLGERPAPMPADDVSVGELVGARQGREVVDRLVEPLLGGVYAGRADVLSVRATMPALAARLADHDTVAAAARAAVAAVPPLGGPVFATLHDGLGDLPAAVAAASGAEILLGTAVCDITRTAAGFRLLTGPVPGRHYVDADAVVLAVPAGKSASLLRSTAPAAATELAGVEYASIALVTLAYRPGSTLPAGSGVLVPSTEGLAIKAITFTTQKWPHRGGGAVLLRASVGRHGDERVLQRSDGELAAVVAEQVALTTGIGSPPIDRLVTRWGGALPQYAVGHLDRVARIRAAVDGVPGLAVCGAAYDGVGVPACIRTGEQAAARIAAHLTSVAAAGGQSDHG